MMNKHFNCYTISEKSVGIKCVEVFKFLCKSYGLGRGLKFLVDIAYKDVCIETILASELYKKISSQIFYLEWAIWSKCFGKIIAMNGVSSSGKTTICKYLENLGYNLISLDNITNEVYLNYFIKETKYMSIAKNFLTDRDTINIMYGYKFNISNYDKEQAFTIVCLEEEIMKLKKNIKDPTRIELYEYMYLQAKKFIFAGESVVLDLVLRESNKDCLFYAFNYYPITMGLLFTSLEQNLLQCFKRNYTSFKLSDPNHRDPSTIIYQYLTFYAFFSKENLPIVGQFYYKVNKDLLNNLLEIAVHCEQRLCKGINFLEGKKFTHYDNKISALADFVKQVLAVSEEIFVTHRAKHNFIIPDFSNETSIDFEIQPQVDSISIKSLEDGSHNRFLLYNTQWLPVVLGNSGQIFEYEYNDDTSEFNLLEDYCALCEL